MSTTHGTERAHGAPALRHFTRVRDLTPAQLGQLLDLAAAMKADPDAYEGALHGDSIACIFEKPSTRTRVSFAAAAARLGAEPIALRPDELQIGRGEPLADTARSLSGYVAAIVIRTFAQATVDELARWATVPVVNALSDEHHPCQALADLLTIRELCGPLAGTRVAFVGDGGDNVAHSLIEAGALAGMHVAIACAPGYEPDPDVLSGAREIARGTGATIEVGVDPAHAVSGAKAVYADVWASMGEETERDERLRAFARYQVTPALMALAAPGAIFLHCLPAKRGEEVAADVIDGPQSVVWRESANRMPTEEALLLALIKGIDQAVTATGVAKGGTMFERIIWATDGSAGADAALTEVKRLAGSGGRIIAVHGTEFLTGRAMGYPADPEEPEILAKIRSQVADLKAEGYNVTVVTPRLHHAPAETIAAIAADEHADLIVCGTRGMSALAGALMGSVSQRLPHEAHVPVLVVPDPPAVEADSTPSKQTVGA